MAELRFFKITRENEDSSIMVFDESEIQEEYNLFGFYYIDENYKENLKEYKEQREDYLNNVPLSEVKETLSEFMDRFEYCDHKNELQSGRPKRLVENKDEDYQNDYSGYFWPEGVKLETPDSDMTYEYYGYWDGSNWKKLYLSGAGTFELEEITEEVAESFANKKYFGNDKPDTNYTSYENYYFDKQSKKLWIERISLFQGVLTDWVLIESDEAIAMYFVMYGSDDTMNELFPEIRENYGYNLIIIEDLPIDPIELSMNGVEAFWEIASKDDMEEIGSWVNDPYKRTHGGTYYLYKDRIISYDWSAFVGDRSTYTICNLSLDEVKENII